MKTTNQLRPRNGFYFFYDGTSSDIADFVSISLNTELRKNGRLSLVSGGTSAKPVDMRTQGSQTAREPGKTLIGVAGKDRRSAWKPSEKMATGYLRNGGCRIRNREVN